MYFCGIGPSLIFIDRGAWFVTLVRVHRKYHISMYFLRKIIPNVSPKEKNCFREKKPSLQIIQEKSCPSAALFEKTIFSERLKKISYFRVLLRGKIIFSGKINILFPNNTKISYSSAIYFERPSFQDICKKKIWFSVQCYQSLDQGYEVRGGFLIFQRHLTRSGIKVSLIN